jgi:4-amino-4-deoxy-L-arabinose transferase-like glycosyltransferase
MNRAQKRSWAFTIGMSVALIFCIAALIVHHLRVGSAKLLWVLAAVAQGTGVVVGFRVKPDKGAVTSDERDEQIKKKAYMAGVGAVYLFVIIVSFAPIAVFGKEGSIPATWMPGLLVGAGLCQAYAMCLATLIQYGRADRT